MAWDSDSFLHRRQSQGPLKEKGDRVSKVTLSLMLDRPQMHIDTFILTFLFLSPISGVLRHLNSHLTFPDLCLFKSILKGWVLLRQFKLQTQTLTLERCTGEHSHTHAHTKAILSMVPYKHNRDIIRLWHQPSFFWSALHKTNNNNNSCSKTGTAAGVSCPEVNAGDFSDFNFKTGKSSRPVL